MSESCSSFTRVTEARRMFSEVQMFEAADVCVSSDDSARGCTGKVIKPGLNQHHQVFPVNWFPPDTSPPIRPSLLTFYTPLLCSDGRFYPAADAAAVSRQTFLMYVCSVLTMDATVTSGNVCRLRNMSLLLFTQYKLLHKSQVIFVCLLRRSEHQRGLEIVYTHIYIFT